MRCVTRTCLCACLASGPASAQQWQAIVLHPSGANYSNAYAVGAGVVGGEVSGDPVLWQGTLLVYLSGSGAITGVWGADQVGGSDGHAALWRGTPESIVDLHPASAWVSGVTGVSGNMQVGVTIPLGGNDRAALWRGTAASFVDLHPAGASRSIAYATDGVFQGGFVQAPDQHATIWKGSAQSAIDLSGGLASEVRAMAPGIQVGWIWIPTLGAHAAVWRGTAASLVDLNPPGWGSLLFGTTGRIHVGAGGGGSLGHAIICFGTRDAWLDLHPFLPPQYTGFSAANAVYQDGATLRVVGYATDNASQRNAILWIGTDPCYPNCDTSTVAPVLNVSDFVCFLNRYAAGEGYANCDGSTAMPILNVADFLCFLNAFAAGCT